MSALDSVDVAIIGGGPAGSSTAATLARAGRSVLLVERRRFPRFHIGESMLPYTAALLDQLGVLDQVKAQGYPVKRGAEFIFPEGGHRRIDFADQGPGRFHETFQLERAHFDTLLLDHARSQGVEVVQEAPVHEVIMDGPRVAGIRFEQDGRTRSVRARYVIDAGGRASKLAQLFGLRKNADRLRNIAVFRHYKGLREEHNPGHEGDIQVGGHSDGWIWAIPIWADTISVGAVMPRSALRGRSHEEVFDEHLARAPRITTRIKGTEPISDLTIETDYNYYTDTVIGPGWFLVGDAGCFGDPIFSGGVFMALASGISAAEHVDRILAEPQREAELQQAYENFYKSGWDTYARLIYAYYDSGYNLSGYNLGKYLRSRGVDIENTWFARLLSGDFWSPYNPIGEFLRDNKEWDTFADFERVYRCPVYAELNESEHATDDAGRTA